MLLAGAFAPFLQGALAQTLPAGFSASRLFATTASSGPTALVSGNPRSSAGRVAIMEELLADYPAPIDGEVARAYAANGVLLISADLPDQPLVLGSPAHYDSGGGGGRVEVVHSRRGLIYRTALAALLAEARALLAGMRNTWAEIAPVVSGKPAPLRVPADFSRLGVAAA